jgi:putative hemolysin
VEDHPERILPRAELLVTPVLGGADGPGRSPLAVAPICAQGGIMKRWPACATPVLVATLFLGACGDDDTDTRVPNPASEFCEERGGTVEIEEDAAGNQVGICVLPDGTRIDEWEYYREEATTTSSSPAGTNP